MDTTTNPPGTSPVYALARDMLDALDKGRLTATAQYGDLSIYLIDGGDYWALSLCDTTGPIHLDTLALWAAAFGVQTAQWAQDWTHTGGRVARLEWATDGEAVEGGRVTWINQVR